MVYASCFGFVLHFAIRRQLITFHFLVGIISTSFVCLIIHEIRNSNPNDMKGYRK